MNDTVNLVRYRCENIIGHCTIRQPDTQIGRACALLACLIFSLVSPLSAQSLPGAAREEVPLTAWRFEALPAHTGIAQTAFDDHTWQTITVPHTWNSKTQIQTYSAAWYRTHFHMNASDRGKEIFVCFDGAGAVADVYLNGLLLGSHRGAYTRFIFDATRAVHFSGDNVLAIRCDSSPADTIDCLPAGNGYQLYHVPGGLYRPVHLLKTSAVHIDPTDLAASGVFLTPQNVSTTSADLEIKTLVRNDSPADVSVTVTSRVYDTAGKEVAAVSGKTILNSQASGTVVLHTHLPGPHLWSTANPYLYKVVTTAASQGQVQDTVTERTGLRFFQMVPSGFFLNGVSTPLRGVSKHQETEEHGSALTPADLKRDWDDLQSLGVNYVRLAHYPHATLEYDLADERGIVVWAENGHSNPAPPTATGRLITREMVLQNYNHPSICFWSVGNEAVRTYDDITTLEDYADAARTEDSSRLITYASNTSFSELDALDFIAVNRYNGWYSSTIDGFDAHAAYYHYISETGSGGVISVHSSAAKPTHKVNIYEPEEYQQEIAESRCETIFRTLSSEVPLFTWWTFRDFGDPRYKGLNTKGLETFGGFRKDVYFLFQTFLKPKTPLVHLCGKPWFLRRRSLPTDLLTLKAYSNAPSLTLTVNGAIIGTRTNGFYLLANGTEADNVFSWDNVLKPGRNTVKVDDGQGHSDEAILYAETGEAIGGASGLIENLQSGDPANPAFFIGEPIQPEWPFYDNFDGTGDNTFHDIPAILQGASWITHRRPAKLSALPALDFTLAPDAGPTDVFLMRTASSLHPIALPAGWTDTGVTGTWRDDTLNLVPYLLCCRTFTHGQTVRIPAFAQDYVVLLKPHPAGS